MIRWAFPRLERVAPGLAMRWFIRLFFTPLKYAIPPKEKEIAKMSADFFVSVNGKKVQGYQWGEGPAVVVVHGWAGRATQFRKFIPLLNRAGYAVIGFDGPAHGRSEGRRVTVLDFEEALKQVFIRIGTPEAVIAHSFGGVASLYAAMNGLSIRTLINIASPTIGSEIISSYV